MDLSFGFAFGIEITRDEIDHFSRLVREDDPFGGLFSKIVRTNNGSGFVIKGDGGDTFRSEVFEVFLSPGESFAGISNIVNQYDVFIFDGRLKFSGKFNLALFLDIGITLDGESGDGDTEKIR